MTAEKIKALLQEVEDQKWHGAKEFSLPIGELKEILQTVLFQAETIDANTEAMEQVIRERDEERHAKN